MAADLNSYILWSVRWQFSLMNIFLIASIISACISVAVKWSPTASIISFGTMIEKIAPIKVAQGQKPGVQQSWPKKLN